MEPKRGWTRNLGTSALAIAAALAVFPAFTNVADADDGNAVLPEGSERCRPADSGFGARPNFRISHFRPDRPVVAEGRALTLAVTVLNDGSLYAPFANLTVYDGIADDANAITWTVVDLREFEASVRLPWTAVGLGNHTLIACVDPLDATEEANEADNTATAKVTVAVEAPGYADLVVTEYDIAVWDMPVVGRTTAVAVRVRNIGDESASDVLVRVEDGGETIALYTAALLVPLWPDVRDVPWTPRTDGDHVLRVTVDETNSIRELDETNNVARAHFYVVWIGDPRAREFDPTPEGAAEPKGAATYQTDARFTLLTGSLAGQKAENFGDGGPARAARPRPPWPPVWRHGV